MNKLHFRQGGFSLVELAIAVFVAGILSVLMAPTFNLLATSNQLGYAEHQALINQEIATALLETAKVRNDAAGLRGRLPNPVTLTTNPTGALYSAIIDPNSDCTQYTSGGAVNNLFACMLQQAGVSFTEVNDDNYDTHRVRVYQEVAGLSQTLPLYFRSGPNVKLTYDYGAIYMTSCPQGDVTCVQQINGTYIPGISPQLGSSNIGGARPWNTVRACATTQCSGPDYPPVFVSSLPAQMQLMQQTTERLDRVRDAMQAYFKTMQISSDASNTTNWYPNGGASMPNANPAQNQNCMDGWFSLTGTNILNTVGLDPVEFGQTAWGGTVEFCRKYIDPNNIPANAAMPPHFAAIRINSDLSSGSAPDPSNSNNNVVLTF